MHFINNFMCSNKYVERTEKEMGIFKKEYPNSEIIFDIGANVGLYTCLFSKYYPFSKIYAFEPVTKSFNLLIENIKTNSIENAICFNIGFSSNAMVSEISMPPDREEYNIGLYSLKIKSGKNAVLASFENMKDWCSKNDLYPDFIKIDAEGSEFDIISSSIDIVKNAKYLVVEANGEDRNKIIDLLSSFFSIRITRTDLLCKNKRMCS